MDGSTSFMLLMPLKFLLTNLKSVMLEHLHNISAKGICNTLKNDFLGKLQLTWLDRN